MNTWLKNLLITFIIIIAPSVVIDMIFYEISALGESTIIVAIGTYAITITGLVLFYRYRPCSMWVLPLAFALPVLICYVKDTLDDSEWFTYLYTGLVLFYYSLPMVLTTFCIAFVLAIHGNMGRERHFHLRNFTLREVRKWVRRKREPLLSAGILTLVFLCIAGMWSVSISRKHMVRRNIIQRIEELTEGEGTCVFKLSDVTDFKWDQVVYFEYPVSAAEISRSAGINYKRSTDLLEGYIFIYRGRVVWEDVVGIAPGSADKAYLGFKGSQLTVLSEKDAFFKGWKEHDRLYLIEPTAGGDTEYGTLR